MKIFVHFSILDRLFARVANVLHDLHPEWVFNGMTLGRLGLHYVRSESRIEWPYLVAFSDYQRAHRHDPIDLNYLRQKEEAYGVPNLFLMAAADHVVHRYPRARMLLELQIAMRYGEEVFDRVQPDIIFSEGIDDLLGYTLYAVARRQGIPFFFPAAGRIAGRMAIIDNPEDRWVRTEALYAHYGENGLPPESRRRAEEFIEHFRQRKPKPGNYFERPLPSVDLKSFLHLLKLARAHWDDPQDRYLLSPQQAVRRRVLRILRRQVADRIYFERPADEEFLLYPLHFDPEAQTLVLAPHLVEQVALVMTIAKSLPVGCWLYVKEHKLMVGRRPLDYYRRILGIPNVKLISPYENSHDLIRRARAITTIGGTMGWEALLYEKPVVTFGYAFYNACPLITHVRDLSRLPGVLRTLLAEFKPNREMLLRFVAAALDGSYLGDLAHPDDTPAVLENGNLKLIAHAFAAEISGLGRK